MSVSIHTVLYVLETLFATWHGQALLRKGDAAAALERAEQCCRAFD